MIRTTQKLMVVCLLGLGLGCMGQVGDPAGAAVDAYSPAIVSSDTDRLSAELRRLSDGAVVATVEWDVPSNSGVVTIQDGVLSSTVPLAFEQPVRADLEQVVLSGLEEAYRASINPPEAPDSLYPDGIGPNAIVGDDLELTSDGVGEASEALAAPHGFFDRILTSNPSGRLGVNANKTAQGWAYDPDVPVQGIWVHFYVLPHGPYSNCVQDTRASVRYHHAASAFANIPREDVNDIGIPGDHGFSRILREAWDGDGYRDSPAMCGSMCVETQPGLGATRPVYEFCAGSVLALGSNQARNRYAWLTHTRSVGSTGPVGSLCARGEVLHNGVCH